MEVYFIRHGQTNGNLARRYQHPGTQLNEEGVKQVEAIASKVVALKPTRVITSTQVRAIETARILTANLSVTPETNSEFTELKIPLWLIGSRFIGLTTFVYIIQWFFGKPIEDGESYQQFFDRIKRARKIIEALPNDERVIIVSHAVFTNMFIEHLCLDRKLTIGQAVLSFFRILTLQNAEIIHLHYSPGANICNWTILKNS